MNDISQNYYVNNKKKLMKEFHDLLITAEKVGQKHFDDEILKIFVEKTLHEFDLILPELPYVGGKESPYTNLMLQSAQTLAFYKACKSLGIDVSYWRRRPRPSFRTPSMRAVLSSCVSTISFRIISCKSVSK